MASNEIWITGVGLVSCAGEGRDAHRATLAATALPHVDLATYAPFAVHPGPGAEPRRADPA
jgi:3-oxoacyl-[acyl-carrier-protein] synthase II